MQHHIALHYQHAVQVINQLLAVHLGCEWQTLIPMDALCAYLRARCDALLQAMGWHCLLGHFDAIRWANYDVV